LVLRRLLRHAPAQTGFSVGSEPAPSPPLARRGATGGLGGEEGR
jgi:hypothetical protein